MKKIFLIAVLVFSLTLTFTSCRPQPPAVEDEVTTCKTVMLENWQEYTLVYSDNVSETVSDAFLDLNRAISEKYNVDLKVNSDFVDSEDEIPNAAQEILIGNTNRKESRERFEKLRVNDYFVGMVGDRLVIIGGSDEYTVKAIEYFKEYFLADDGFMRPEIEYTYRYDYLIDYLTIGGVGASEYTIVLGEGLSDEDKRMVDELRGQIADICGVDIPVVNSYAEESVYEILIGDTKREETSKRLEENTYAIEQTDSKLAIYGNGKHSISYAIRTFIKNELTGIPKGSGHNVSVENVFGETVIMPSLVETNLLPKIADISGEYENAVENVDSVIDRFFITMDELPDEITVLDKISLDDFPASKQKKQVYVSVKRGSDSNPGTEEAPLRSIAKAAEKMKNAGGGVIWIEGGMYTVTESIVFDSTHSGTIESPLFIIGYGDEPVVITDNAVINNQNFKKVDPTVDKVAARLPEEAQDKVVYTNLYDLGFTYDDIPKVTTSGSATLYVDGEEFTLARFPNAYYEDGITHIDIKDLMYFNHVYEVGSVSMKETTNYAGWVERVNAPGSGLTMDSQIGWEIQLPYYGENDDEVCSWVNTGDIWYYGSVYSGWEFGYYTMDPNCVHDGNLLGFEKEGGYYSLKSVQPCIYGASVSANSAAGRNTFYMFNAIEALDVPGEWFIDKETGNLYIYPKKEDISKQYITYSGDKKLTLLRMLETSFAVVDNIHVNGASHTGVYTFSCDNIVLQNISTTNVRYSGLVIELSYNIAVTHSEFSHSKDSAMVNITNVNSITELKPTNIIFQNNIVRDTSQTKSSGLQASGCRIVISHNDFIDACMTTSGLENIIEYNEFVGGNKFVTDGGMVYMTGYNNRGHHIRYNLFHQFHATHNAVYNDGKTSGVYTYGNIVSTLGSDSNLNKGWYSSSGHGNVCYANIMVFRSAEEIAAAKGLDLDEETKKYIMGDSIDESGLFYYYYGDGDSRNSEAGHWWTGHRIEEINYRFNKSDAAILKQRFPDYMANITRIKLILAAYEVGYMPTYDPQPLSGKEFIYTDVEDGEKLYIPEYEYIDESGKIAVMPERTLTAENGYGFAVTYDDIAAMERLERQPAFSFISNNLVLGGLKPNDTIDDVITNGVEEYKGYVEGTSEIYNNYHKYNYSSIMPNISKGDYTIPKEAWDSIAQETSTSFVRILAAIDYTGMGKIK